MSPKPISKTYRRKSLKLSITTGRLTTCILRFVSIIGYVCDKHLQVFCPRKEQTLYFPILQALSVMERVRTVSTDEEEELNDTDLAAGNKDTFVLEVKWRLEMSSTMILKLSIFLRILDIFSLEG